MTGRPPPEGRRHSITEPSRYVSLYGDVLAEALVAFLGQVTAGDQPLMEPPYDEHSRQRRAGEAWEAWTLLPVVRQNGAADCANGVSS